MTGMWNYQIRTSDYILLLMDLMDKEENHARTDGECKERDRNPKNESKRNARDQYTVTEIKKAFDGLLGKLDIAEERILRKFQQKPPMQRDQRPLKERKKKAYPRTMRQVQNV